jgi:hypothetical protein
LKKKKQNTLRVKKEQSNLYHLNDDNFFPFGGTAQILALAYLHETFPFHFNMIIITLAQIEVIIMK